LIIKQYCLFEKEGKVENILQKLIERGNHLVSQPYKKIEFTKNNECNELLNDLTEFPQAFVLGCLMDRQMKAERAWEIPCKIHGILNGFEIEDLYQLKLTDIKNIFETNNLHRFNETMSKIFYLAIERIQHKYKGDVSDIWNRNPGSASVVRKFLEFYGCGQKIATMATNILYREFKIPMKDCYSIDISPDRHVAKVFKRIGFAQKNDKQNTIIYIARELNPEYPGIFDLSCFEIGVKWCKTRKPHCEECYLSEQCPKPNH
jgi:endonuclease-3